MAHGAATKAWSMACTRVLGQVPGEGVDTQPVLGQRRAVAALRDQRASGAREPTACWHLLPCGIGGALRFLPDVIRPCVPSLPPT